MPVSVLAKYLNFKDKSAVLMNAVASSVASGGLPTALAAVMGAGAPAPAPPPAAAAAAAAAVLPAGMPSAGTDPTFAQLHAALLGESALDPEAVAQMMMLYAPLSVGGPPPALSAPGAGLYAPSRAPQPAPAPALGAPRGEDALSSNFAAGTFIPQPLAPFAPSSSSGADLVAAATAAAASSGVRLPASVAGVATAARGGVPPAGARSAAQEDARLRLLALSGGAPGPVAGPPADQAAAHLTKMAAALSLGGAKAGGAAGAPAPPPPGAAAVPADGNIWEPPQADMWGAGR
jgi:hypothetical protein